MSEVSVAVLDQFHPGIEQAIREALPHGWSVRFAAAGDVETRTACLAEADVAFVMAAHMPPEMLAATTHLKLIQKLGAGVDRIDLDMCRARGIAVARLAAGNSIPVAEHTILLILAAYRRLPLMDRRTREGQWGKEEARGLHRQITGKTIGLLGFGAVGRELAGMLSGFDVQILYYDPFPAPAELEQALRVTRVELDELLARADIVSLHLPLMAETQGLIDAARIASMKRGAVLINCARGGLVDEQALADALAEGRLMAAGIDAFADEPPVGSPLLASEHTVVTPHLAGATLDNFASVAERAVYNAARYLRGEGLPEGDAVFVPEEKPATA